MNRFARGTAVVIFLAILLAASCGEVGSPLEPGPGVVVPVTGADQLTGLWQGESAVVGGLPLNAWTVPAFLPGQYNARIRTWNSQLIFTRTGARTGVFTVLADGAAADTANPLITSYGDFEYWGDIVIGEEGALTVTLRQGDSQNRPWNGTAGLVADTLIVNFTLTSPPEKRVGFLPDSVGFIVRMVKQ